MVATNTNTNGHGILVNVEEATLKTLGVEIRSLVVNNKQMTLAVFRQLMEDNPVGCYYRSHVAVDVAEAFTCIWYGPIWGQVNYHWAHCGDGHHPSCNHTHVVWQKGDELRRGVICDDPEHIGHDDWVRSIAVERIPNPPREDAPSRDDRPAYAEWNKRDNEVYWPALSRVREQREQLKAAYKDEYSSFIAALRGTMDQLFIAV